MEAVFLTNSEIKKFYKNYNRHDEQERMSLNHRRVPII